MLLFLQSGRGDGRGRDAEENDLNEEIAVDIVGPVTDCAEGQGIGK